MGRKSEEFVTGGGRTMRATSQTSKLKEQLELDQIGFSRIPDRSAVASWYVREGRTGSAGRPESADAMRGGRKCSARQEHVCIID